MLTALLEEKRQAIAQCEDPCLKQLFPSVKDFPTELPESRASKV